MGARRSRRGHLLEVGHIEGWPVATGEGLCHVSSSHDARDLVNDPQGARGQLLAGLEEVEVHHHVLVVVGAAVVGLHDLGVLLSGAGQCTCSTDPLPAHLHTMSTVFERSIKRSSTSHALKFAMNKLNSAAGHEPRSGSSLQSCKNKGWQVRAGGPHSPCHA